MVKKDQVISIVFTLTDEQGTVLGKFDDSEPLEYLFGHESIIPGLDAVLEGHKVGDAFKVTIPAKDAYGEYDPEDIFRVPKEQVNGGDIDSSAIGRYAWLDTDEGVRKGRITEVTDEIVAFDANHHLAGKDLTFDLEIVGSRKATAEELAQGSLHAQTCGSGSCHGNCSSCH